MKNRRTVAAQDQPRPSSIISRIRAHRRATASEPAGSFKFLGGADADTGHTMHSTPYFLTKPSLLT